MSKRAQSNQESLAHLPRSLVAELFEGVPEVAFFVKDSQGRYVAVNQSLMLRVGLKNREDVIGKNVRDVYPPDLADCYEQQDMAVLKHGLGVRDQLELHWHTNRQRGWCLTTKLPLLDANGGVIGLVGVSRDINGTPENATVPKGVADAVDHLHANFGDPISPSVLAKVAGMPASRFARLTHRLFGLTPTQLIAQTRLQAATEALAKTNSSVADIALLCGFTDHSAFTRAFRTATGMTPSTFRAQAKG